MPNHAIEYIIIFVYILVLSNIGRIFKSFNKNSSDYFRGGGRTTWWMLGASVWISSVSASVFTGVAGAIYESGTPPLASNWSIVAAGFLLAMFLAAWFRQLRLITSVEVVRQRFGVVTEQVYAYIGMILQPCFGAFQLFGLSIFVSAIFGFPLHVVIVTISVVIALYAVAGGKWAIMATDFLQSLILIPVSILVAVLAVAKMGGVGAFVHGASEAGLLALSRPAGEFGDGKYTWGWVAAVFLMGVVSQLQLNWSARFFAAKDGKEAKKSAWLMTILFVIGTIVFSIPPMVARMLYSDQVMTVGAALNKPAEAAYVTVCQNLLPTGLIGLIIMAMFAATVSSMDTGINGNAAVIIRNMIPPLRRVFKKKELSPESELVAGRITSLCLVVYIAAIALYLAKQDGMGIFELILGFSAAVSFPIVLPTFLAVFFRGAPRCSALFSVVGGLVLPWIWIPLLGKLGVDMTYQLRVLVIGASGTIGYFLSYPFRRKESAVVREQIDEFYTRMHTPIDFEKEIGEANDHSQMLIVGRLSMVVAVLMLLLLIIPNELWARGCILALSGSVGLIGGLLLMGARRHTHRSRRAANSK